MNATVRTHSSAVPRKAPTGLLIGLALVALAMCLAPTPSATASAGRANGPDGKPTIVLVHGGWAGPATWDEVVTDLRKDGYTTVTPQLETMSVAGDVATVQAALDAIPGRKLLVG